MPMEDLQLTSMDDLAFEDETDDEVLLSSLYGSDEEEEEDNYDVGQTTARMTNKESIVCNWLSMLQC